MKCAKCHVELSKDERFCGECGHPVAVAVAPSLPIDAGGCPNCGAKPVPGQRFCGSCGHDLQTSSPQSPTPVSPPGVAKKRRRWPYAFVVGVVVLGGLVWMGYPFVHNSTLAVLEYVSRLGQKPEERLYDSLLGCHTDEIRSFLAAGMNPNTRVRGDDWRLPALSMAAICTNADPVKALIAAGADVNAKEKTAGATALMFARGYSSGEAVRFLQQAGAKE